MNDKYQTPKDFYAKLDRLFNFDKFDPCPIDWKQGDPSGLEMDWADRTFVNPPYSHGKTRLWVNKAIREANKGKLVVMLLRCDTSTQAFHRLIKPNATKIVFVEGRILFNGKPANFASMVVVFGDYGKLEEIKGRGD